MNAQPLAGVPVLLVEDNTDGRELLEAFLRFVGANVRSAANAEDAFELFKQTVPAVVITDIVLPRHDGVWLLEQVRASTAGVHVIALTGRALPADTLRLRSLGFDEHLVKPVDLNAMISAIVRLTGRPGEVQRDAQ
jgi:two-component system, sensor histidine kinase